MKCLFAYSIFFYFVAISLSWANCIEGDCINGKGTYIFSKGSKYVGEYRNGKYHGQGTDTTPGYVYKGEYKYGKRHGQGTYTRTNGDKYVGEYRNGQRHGQGTYSDAEGHIYVGEFRNGQGHGQFVVTYNNGDKYVGQFIEGLRNGRGTYTFSNGSEYVGQWKDSKYNGKGTLTFASGEKYIGRYKEGRRHGKGTFTYFSGTKYVGQWKDDKYNGWGSLTYADGRVQKGIFKNGQCQNCEISIAKKVKKTCSNNPSLCTVAQLCSNATTEKNKKKVWDTSNSAQPFVEEAKKNGVTCGVETPPVKANKQKDTFKVASGSGFYVSKEGHVVTNHHVIDGCRNVKIFAKGNLIDTNVIASDELNDLALLKASVNPPYVFPVSSETPFGTQEIVVAGYPFGNKLSSSIKFTKGIVSSLTGVGDNYSEIQIDAALQPGNSGGPIIDEYGNVIAVAVAKLDVVKIVEDFGTLPENTNFGIKASTLMSLLKSHQIPLVRERKKEIKSRDLSKNATDGTVFLTCWMTKAQIDSYKKKKVMFDDFND
ncbi:MAG: trypsin-like peptidase domain-containing protein [Paracoccaceae bacterium]